MNEQKTPLLLENYKGCMCRTCLDANNIVACISPSPEFQVPATSAMMVLCPACGNKRCPHATNHELPCTNSNKPGQLGSVY